MFPVSISQVNGLRVKLRCVITIRCGGVVDVFIATGRSEKFLPSSRYVKVYAGNRDAFRRIATREFR